MLKRTWIGSVLCCLLGIGGCGEGNSYIEQLHSGTVEQRAQAATFLGAQRAGDAIPALRIALRDTVPEVRAKVVWALGMLGAKDAMVGLVPLLQDSSRRVRQQTAVALMYLEEPEVLPALELALKMEKDPWIQADLKRAIAHLQQFEGDVDVDEGTFR